MTIRFKKNYKKYTAGQVATLPVKVEKILIKEGIAVDSASSISGVVYRIAGSNSPLSSTNTTNEEILVSTIIPGGVMGTNGGLRVSVWSESAGANTGNRDIFIRYGGQFIGEGRLAVAATPAAAGMSQWEIWNTSETTQLGQHATSSSLNAIATAPAFKTSNVNSAVEQILQIRTKKSVGTDDFKILRWSVEVLPPLA